MKKTITSSKLILLLLTVVPFINVRAQQLTFDNIPLSWNDFQRVDNNALSMPTAAMIYTAYRYNILSKGGKTTINTQCYVNKGMSQVKTDFLNRATSEEKNKVLQHEKGHVAIALIYQKLLQHMLTDQAYTYRMRNEVDSIFRVCEKIRNMVNKNYDSETSHGLNMAEQKTWENTLSEQLNNAYPAVSTIPFQLSTGIINLPMLVNKRNDPVSYNYSNNYSIAFEENFEEMNTPAAGHNGSGSVTTDTLSHRADGLLFVSNNNDTTNWWTDWNPVIDYTRDFEIELSFKIENTEKKRNYAFGLFWGEDTVSHYNTNLRVSAASNVLIVLCHGGDHKDDKRTDFYTYPHIASREFNKINLRKTGDTYAVFVNDKFRKSVPYETLRGQNISLEVYKDVSIVFDYLKVFYLN
jgi:hypothetical protein